MYAVIKTGGKQYKVVAGEKLKVEQIPADIGSELTIDQVLAVGAGDTIKWKRSIDDYKASDGWTLKYAYAASCRSTYGKMPPWR